MSGTVPTGFVVGKNRGTHCMGEWVGRRAGLDVSGGFFFLTEIRTLDRPAHSIVTIATALPLHTMQQIVRQEMNAHLCSAVGRH